jgi:hypothetical protein
MGLKFTLEVKGGRTQLAGKGFDFNMNLQQKLNTRDKFDSVRVNSLIN